MPAKTATDLLRSLTQSGVDFCVGGGWGVDALLGEQTRLHSDLDVWVPAAHMEPLVLCLAGLSIDRVAPWPDMRPWNFVLHDTATLRVDLHFYEELSTEMLHYGAATGGHTFPAHALGSTGSIDGLTVRCEAAEWSVRWHTGYPLRDVDRVDVPLLCDRFGIPLPEAYR